MKQRFHWDAWNREHIASHGVSLVEAEEVVRGAIPPFPRNVENEKQLVWGRTAAGRMLQVIYVLLSDEDIDYQDLSVDAILELSESEMPYVYVIHARELNAREKSSYRRYE